MKKYGLAFILFNIFLVLCSQAQENTGLPIGSKAPNFSLKGQDGKRYSLTDFKGKIVVLDFWASWCGPCKMGMPDLHKIQEIYKEQGIVVIGINVFENEKEGKEYFNKQKFNYLLLFGTEEMAKTYKITAIPQIYIIDGSGQIIFSKLGYFPDMGKKLRQVIDEALKKK